MKKRALSSLLIASLILAGCSFNKTIQNWNTAHIVFTGTFNDKAMFENRDITVVAGSGDVISGVDTAIIGMKEWESKTITISPDLWYGKAYKTSNIQKVSKLIFDKMQIPSGTSWVVSLGGLMWVVKWTESDWSWTTLVLFDMNPPQTRQNMTYTVLVKEIK